MEIPKNLDEAIKGLGLLIQDCCACPDDIDYLQEISINEDSFTANLHMTLGRYMRNNWGLWKKEGELYDMFVQLGLEHPDDMSGLILTSYYRQKNNLPLKISEEIKYYQDYWKNIKTNVTNITIDLK